MMWLHLVGCLVDVPRGPDLGLCADLPEGTYGYGDAGIGTCLAGPADLVFFQQDGGTFLAVTNADPYREFRSGSALVIPWDPLAGILTAIDGPPETILMSDIDVLSLPIEDDDNGDGNPGNPYLGGFGYIPSSQKAVVTSRLTEGFTANATQNGLLRVGQDEMYVLDLQNMERAGGGLVPDASTPEVRLEDDPFPVIVDPSTGLLYVGNLTDHSISVLTSTPEAPTGCTPDPDCEIDLSGAGEGDTVCRCDVAEGASALLRAVADPDLSGSSLEISKLSVLTPKTVAEDLWTLTFLEGTVTAFVPTENEDASIDGLQRYTSGDARDFLPSPFGFETGLGEVREPFVESTGAGVNYLYFARSDGELYRAISSPYGLGGEWFIEDGTLLPGLGGWLGAPCAAPLAGEVGLYAERRDEIGGEAEIILATSLDGSSFTYNSAVLTPPPGTSYEDPFAVLDEIAGHYRMWLTVRQGARSSVALSVSEDGLSWSEPVAVLEDPLRSLAAPSIAVLEGRYGMWLSSDEGDRWDHLFSWSYDGIHWSEPEPSITGDAQYDPLDPPRVALLSDRSGSFRIEGADYGVLPAYLSAGGDPLALIGFDLAVSNGYDLDNDIVPSGRAEIAISPGSGLQLDDGRKILYATTIGRQLRSHIAAFEEIGGVAGSPGDWVLATDPQQITSSLGVDGAGEAASDPVVIRDGDGYRMYFTRWESGVGRLRTATSPDGLTAWTPDGGDLLPSEDGSFDSASQRPHSAQILSDGRVRLWFTGFDGSTSRIGSAIAPSPGGNFALEQGTEGDYRLSTGLPGSFDDSSVSDPLVVTFNEQTHLYYTGFDGTYTSLGHAIIEESGAITRPIDPLTGTGEPSMTGLVRTFSAQGVDSLVLWETPETLLSSGLVLGGTDNGELGTLADTDRVGFLYAGFDGTSKRLGRASMSGLSPSSVFAEQRFATSGDTISFETFRGGPGAQVIELAAALSEFTSQGFGMSSMALDEDRGFLYVTTKLDDIVFVLDIRDDSNGSFIDRNYLDIEALVTVDTGNALAGGRDIAISRTRGLGYLSLKSPDGIAVIDLTLVPDDDVKEQIVVAPATILPLQSSGEDAGVATLASYSGGRAALTPDERTLVVPHFRGNGVSVFDLGMSAFGAEIAWIPNVGENPHVAKVSPDGQWAVIANYLGDVVDGTVSSTLAIIDLRPDSASYLETVAWLKNH